MSTMKMSRARPLFGRMCPRMAAAMADRRRVLLASLTGEVVEVGTGTASTSRTTWSR
ncbi:hypothetical protein [Spongiactinospora rosea]|uniref:hypothetical protein n=1 Tax=Spongiactinospora rosea TaxID=2248750 RepID=UPI0018F47FEC|nr:hypothetical protein [Spongiactinospora rosea]